MLDLPLRGLTRRLKSLCRNVMNPIQKKLEKDHLLRLVEVEKDGASASPIGLEALKESVSSSKKQASIIKKSVPSEEDGTTRKVLVFLKPQPPEER